MTEHLSPTNCVGQGSKLERPAPTFLQTAARELRSIESRRLQVSFQIERRSRAVDRIFIAACTAVCNDGKGARDIKIWAAEPMRSLTRD